MNKPKYASMVSIALLLPVLGGLLMFTLIYLFPMWRDSIVIYAVYALLITMLGLVIPYGFLKAFSIAAHEWDPHEGELHFKDMGKDKDQLKKTLP